MRKLDCAFERVSGNMVDKTLWRAASFDVEGAAFGLKSQQALAQLVFP
jgi:hypothetical protein